MVTITQLINKRARRTKHHKSWSPALEGRPHKKGICKKIVIRKPKKPNSAQRKVANVRLGEKHFLNIYIPGLGHNIQKFAVLLFRGGRVPDLPGIRYHAIRGKFDFAGPERFERVHRRSKFGKKKPKKESENSESESELESDPDSGLRIETFSDSELITKAESESK